jgi:hypothetical protein
MNVLYYSWFNQEKKPKKQILDISCHLFFLVRTQVILKKDDCTQIKRYDDRKRQFPVVYTDEYVRIHEYYDRIRAVEHPFGRDRITAVNHRSYAA